MKKILFLISVITLLAVACNSSSNGAKQTIGITASSTSSSEQNPIHVVHDPNYIAPAPPGMSYVRGLRQYIPIPDYKSDIKDQFKKTSPDETIEHLVGRLHPGGKIDALESDMNFSQIPEAKAYYSYGVKMPDGTYWDESVYDLGSYYWVQWSDHYSASGTRLNPPKNVNHPVGG
jgi:hypothetical protein